MPSLRHDTARAVILARIATAWDKVPHMTLGQLLFLSLSDSQFANIDKLDDQQVAEAVERFVLKP